MHRLVACACLAVLAAPGQHFEVASIRLGDPKAVGGRVQSSPGDRFSVTSCQLSFIIQQVYGLEPWQMVDAPKWISAWDYRYDIQAKAVAPTTSAQLRLMAQAMLADRFQLKVHREMREVPVYFLVAGKKGLKLDVVKAGGRGGIESVAEGIIRGRATTSDLILVLSRGLDRPILDKTGFTEQFDFRLEWASNPQPEDTRASLFVAIQEQLGLKLDPQKAPAEVLVIDHVEKPSAN